MEGMRVVELAAVAFGVASVVLSIRQHIWCWPTGLVMVVLYIFIYYRTRLYSDMGLQVVYVALQIYGWWHWLHGGRERGELKVSRLSRAGAAGWLMVAVAGTAGLGHVMKTYTNADLPYGDAAPTVLSLIAQWLMAKKVLESWWLWITVDVLYLGIYNYKALYLTMGMYGLFLMLATSGWWEWRKTCLAPAAA